MYDYGSKNDLRALDESEFWKRQEAEHTTVIRLVTPDLEQKYTDMLADYQESFLIAQAACVRYIESLIRARNDTQKELDTKIKELLSFLLDQSKGFVSMLKEMLNNSEALQKNEAAKVVVHHIIRESEYYIGVAE